VGGGAVSQASRVGSVPITFQNLIQHKAAARLPGRSKFDRRTKEIIGVKCFKVSWALTDVIF
jgi:hypothetical protein